MTQTKIKAEIETKKEKKIRGTDFKPSDIQAFKLRLKGNRIQQIATEMGVDRTTVWRKIKQVNQDLGDGDQTWRDKQLAKLRHLVDLGIASHEANLEFGDVEALKLLYKTTGLMIEKIEIEEVGQKGDSELKELARKLMLKLSEGKNPKRVDKIKEFDDQVWERQKEKVKKEAKSSTTGDSVGGDGPKTEGKQAK